MNTAARSSLHGRVVRAGRRALPLNVGVVADRAVRRCRLLYTWGKIPLWPRRPRFVVELDNPYVLTLYQPSSQRALRPVLRRALGSSRCAGIVCISHACRQTLEAELGPRVAAKARVVYPHPGTPPVATPGSRNDLRFVFVGTQFWLKGGRELCAAFERVARDHPRARLTVVSRTPAEVKRRYEGAPIKFLDATMSREEVGRLLADADAFVLPTMVESFGLAVLEAVSAGLPVVATRIYALPELVEHGRNGLLLPDPLGYWRAGLPDPRLWRMADLDEHVRGREFPALAQAVEGALRTLCESPTRLAEMAAESRALFAERYSPERHAEALRSALSEFAEAA